MSDIFSALALKQNPNQAYFQKLLDEGMNTAPISSHWQGASRLAHSLLAGMYLGQQNRDQEASQALRMNLPGLGGDTPQAAPEAAPAPASGGLASALASPPQDRGPTRIYDQNERNPLDPPAGADRDMLIRAIHAEAGNQGPDGMRAVASVVRNRAANGGFGGDTVSGVLKAPNQFEPMNTPQGQQRMASLPVGSNQYSTIGKTVDEAYGGNDPTNGATNFFAPKAQAALGRPVPAWAQGPGQDIGAHRFFGSPQMAQADPAALPPNATPTQGGPVPMAQPQQPLQPPQRATVQIPPQMQQQIRAMIGSKDPALQQQGMELYKQYAKPAEMVDPMTPDQRKQWQVPEGMSAGIDRVTGKPVFSPAQTNVSVNSVADPIREGIGKTFNENRTHALTASRELIPQLHDARTALDQGALTGQFADIKLMMHKVGTAFGMTDEQASNTETFRATIGRQVLGMAKSLGANPSNADRDYIEKVQGGQIKLEEGSLRRLMDITEKYARQAITNHNSDADKIMAVQPDAYKGVAPIMRVDVPPQYQKPSAPAQAAPQQAPAQGGVRKYNPATGKIE